MQTIGVVEARTNFASLLRQVSENNEKFVVLRRGEPRAAFVPIEDLERMERSLQNADRRFHDFAKTSSDWFWEMGPDFRFRWLSEGYEEKVGLSSISVIGKTRWEVTPGKGNGEIWVKHRADLEAHLPFNDFEYEVETEGGDIGYRSVSGVPIFDEQENFLGYRGTAKDITERKKAEEALRYAHDQLETRVKERSAELQKVVDELLITRDEARVADRAKSEFLAVMSHELRTPLNAILGFSEVIKDEVFGPNGNAQYRDYAKFIHECGHHLLGLITDILDLSKIESMSEELHEEAIEIPEIIQSAVKLVGQRAEQTGPKVKLELPAKLPALRADARKLKQILVNLISNAVKFTGTSGQVTLRSWYRTDCGFVFQISDTDIGIAPEDIPKAFSHFGQIDDHLRRRYPGTGLGLPLTKALVELHGGTIDLESKVDVGTTVTVCFPAERIVISSDNSGAINMADGLAN